MQMLILPLMFIEVLFDGDYDDVCFDVRLIMVAFLMLMSGKAVKRDFQKKLGFGPSQVSGQYQFCTKFPKTFSMELWCRIRPGETKSHFFFRKSSLTASLVFEN